MLHTQDQNRSHIIVTYLISIDSMVAITDSANEEATPRAVPMKITIKDRLVEYFSIDSSVAFPSSS